MVYWWGVSVRFWWAAWAINARADFFVPVQPCDSGDNSLYVKNCKWHVHIYNINYYHFKWYIYSDTQVLIIKKSVWDTSILVHYSILLSVEPVTMFTVWSLSKHPTQMLVLSVQCQRCNRLGSVSQWNSCNCVLSYSLKTQRTSFAS